MYVIHDTYILFSTLSTKKLICKTKLHLNRGLKKIYIIYATWGCSNIDLNPYWVSIKFFYKIWTWGRNLTMGKNYNKVVLREIWIRDPKKPYQLKHLEPICSDVLNISLAILVETHKRRIYSLEIWCKGGRLHLPDKTSNTLKNNIFLITWIKIYFCFY